MTTIYPGRIPSNVNRDAKYSVRSSDGGYVVSLLFRLSQRERALLATDRHEALVEMVNDIKVSINGAPGGVFYINEFTDVLVPCQDNNCYFAGTYDELLEFEFEGEVIGPRAPVGLEPGEPWPGPHVGIPYTLKAGAGDIGYEWEPRPGVIRTELLSDYHDSSEVEALTRRLAAVKGTAGGRIYVNECGEFFAPVNDDYLFLGHIGEDVWFPAPDVPRP